MYFLFVRVIIGLVPTNTNSIQLLYRSLPHNNHIVEYLEPERGNCNIRADTGQVSSRVEIPFRMSCETCFASTFNRLRAIESM